MKIKSDTLHSLFIRTISSLAFRRRDILDGSWNGEKCVCFSFDCDYEDDLKACRSIIELLQAQEVSTSFAIPGHLAKNFPEIVKEILKSRHEILNHTLSHFPNFRDMSSNDIRSEVEGFQEFMMQTYNYLPRGFRTPHGLRKKKPELFEILKENGMYDSSILGYGVTNINGMWEIPLTPCPEHPSMAFDSYHHFRFPLVSSSEKKVLRLWTLMLQKNAFINIFLDPIDLADKNRLRLLEQIIGKAKDSGFTFDQMGRLYEKLNNGGA